jgi:hypothetical protein
MSALSVTAASSIPGDGERFRNQSGFVTVRARNSKSAAMSSRRRLSSSLPARVAQSLYQPARLNRSAASLAASLGGVFCIANDAQDHAEPALIQIKLCGRCPIKAVAPAARCWDWS